MDQLLKFAPKAEDDMPISEVDKHVDDESMTGNSAIISGQITARQNTAKTQKQTTDLDSIGSDWSDDNYDPFKVPPDFKLAQRHASAIKVNNLAISDLDVTENIDLNATFWPCCNLPYEAKSFPLCIDSTNLGELGCGFPLFFDLIRYLIYIMGLCSIVGIYAMVDNYSADNGSDYDEQFSDNPILAGSLGAHGKDGHPNIAQSWLNVVLSWITYCMYVYLWKKHKRLLHQIDEDTITPSDFTLLLSGLPKIFEENKLKEFLTKQSLPGAETEIWKITPIYSIDGYVQMKKDYQKWRRRQETSGEKQGWFQFNRQHCSDKVQQLKDKLEQEEANIIDGKFTGQVLVTYKYEAQAKSAMHNLGKPSLKKCWNRLIAAFKCFRDQSQFEFEGKKFYASRAPEPSDIIWENIGETVSLRRRFVTGLITISLLCVSGVVVYLSAEWKRSTKQDGISDPSDPVFVEMQILYILPSLIIVSINNILCFVIKFFTKFEHYSTMTSFQTSVAIKITIALYVNTAVIPVAIYWNDWYGIDSLTTEMTYLIMINAVISPVVPFFEPERFITWIRSKWALYQGKDCKLTQQEANDLFQGIPIDMAKRHANIMKTFLICMFYGPVLPIAYPITVLSLLAEYWTNKILLIRTHCRPAYLSNNIDKVMIRCVPVGIALFSYANLLFHTNYNSDAIVPGAIGMGISALLLLTPWQRILKMKKMYEKSITKMITSITDNLGEIQTYEDYAVEFYVDYDRWNPITSEQGYQYWHELLQKNNKHGQFDYLKSLVGEKINTALATAFNKFTAEGQKEAGKSVFVQGIKTKIAGLASYNTKAPRNTKLDKLIFSRQWVRGTGRGGQTKSPAKSRSPTHKASLINQAKNFGRVGTKRYSPGTVKQVQNTSATNVTTASAAVALFKQ